MLRNLIVCGFALAALALLVSDANAFGKRRNNCSSSGSSCATTTSCHTTYQPAPCHTYQPAPAPAPMPAPAPCYTCQQPVYYASSCGTVNSSCGRGCGSRRCR